MKAIHSLIAATLYTLSLSTLLAMAVNPPSTGEARVEFGPATVIAVESPAWVADAENIRLRREIS